MPARQGVRVPVADLFGTAGRRALDELRLDPPFTARAASLMRLIDALDFEIDAVTRRVAGDPAHHPGYRAVQTIPGVSPVLAAVFVAEIGDVTRFPSPRQRCPWAGMTPQHRESDTKVHHGRITKQGNTLVHWTAVEAVQPVHHGPLASRKARLSSTRGTNIANAAAGHELLTPVYYGLRDGHVRYLATMPAAA